MSLYKRKKTWWTDFAVNGQRYRQSLDTSDWREAQAREKELITRASEGKLTTMGQQFARLPFCEALDRYLVDRSTRVAAKSHRSECDHAKPLRRYFASTSLIRMSADPGFILQYIRERSGAGISNTTMNMEIGIVRRILKRARRWHVVADDLRPLPERRDIGRALAHEEKAKLLRTAQSRPEWQVARCAAIITLNTTMRGAEHKTLLWKDVDLKNRVVSIRRSKTAAGQRLIPLNDDAMKAMVEMFNRATVVGGTDPNHYVFPACENGNIDPRRPQTSWRSAWRSLTRAAGLRGLRFHDLRHHAITELAESEASDQTIMSIAGHVSQRMLAHYSHVRLEAKRRALEALSRKKPDAGPLEDAGGYVTNHVTNGALAPGMDAQLDEKNGGDDETRTRDLCRDRAAF